MVETMASQGICVCFANPGTTEMWLVGALASQDTHIRSILCLHETVCSGACDGYARMARKPALCLLHLGVGLVNGLANLHNAKRARSPVLVLVGEMATWHRPTDAPLCMDIQAAAGTVSTSVTTCDKHTELVTDTVRAVQAANRYSLEPTASRVSTLIVGHDITWETADWEEKVKEANQQECIEIDALKEFVQDCAEALKNCPRGAAALYLGGRALLEEGGALVNAGKIAVKLGASLVCENGFSRVDRGDGLPSLVRIPYFPKQAQQELSKYQVVVTVDVRLPVAQFGYDQGPSEILQIKEDFIWELNAGQSTPLALEELSEAVGARDVVPGVNCGGIFPPPKRPPLPVNGKLKAADVCTVVSHLQPNGCIVVDESITSGSSYWDMSKGCPQFSHLTLTGGAIGSGLPMAVGAAIACPDRPVINLQADGSGMYSLQALWTQAREALRVITVIFSNNVYGILQLEAALQGVQGLATDAGRANLRNFTDLSTPEINWVSLAKGMGVPSTRATSVREFHEQFQQALAATGPVLIQAVLAP